MAISALTRELARPEYRRLRAELELPAPGTTFYTSRVSWLAGDEEAHRVQGQDVYLFDLALNLLYQQQPATGILCWLYDQALGHGWIAAAGRQAFTAEIQAALDAGLARPGMGWDGICTLLRSGAGDVATSLPGIGSEFPDPGLALEAGTWSPGLRSPDDPDEIDALWDQVGHAGQWDLCMQALHAQPARQWRPAAGYVFGDFTLKPETGLARAAPLARCSRRVAVQPGSWLHIAGRPVKTTGTPGGRKSSVLVPMRSSEHEQHGPGCSCRNCRRRGRAKPRYPAVPDARAAPTRPVRP
jgi:hypothetical protein